MPIAFGEAIPIAGFALGVNMASAWLLRGGDGLHAHHHAHGLHEQGHGHDQHQRHGHEDHRHDQHRHHGEAQPASHGDTNFRAAYVHVLADALTSVLAIIALTAGRPFGWSFLDPLMGLVGTVVIVAWAANLLRSAGAVLLDILPSPTLSEAIGHAVERDGNKVADLHLWRLQGMARRHRRWSHVTVEVHRCAHEGALAA